MESKTKLERVTFEELNQRKLAYLDYLSALSAIFDRFSSTNNAFTVSFTDKDGVVLFTMSTAKDPIIFEGLVIRENLGKTAISVALKKCKEVEIKGDEHTEKILSNWSCAAVPVFDHKREMVGVLSISSEKTTYSSFALGIASIIANAISDEVYHRMLLKEVDISKKFIEVFAEGSKDGVIVLDKNANIVYINSTGASILKIEKEKAIGRNVTEIVDFTPVILNVFKTHKGYVDKEFIIESPSRGLLHFVKTAVVLRDSEGNFTGVVDFFREIEKVRKFVASFIGAEARFTFDDIKGKSIKLKEAIRVAHVASHSNASVLLVGETGTGKEMFAQAIHFDSNRSSGPFVALNCGAVPRDIAESELFGYEAGAFTDADIHGRPGKFELANGGTLFLDQIEELPPMIQTKLLRVLEDKVVTRVGGTKSLKIDVRIIAATNKNLEEVVESNSFRGDLYYRLNVIQIYVPPLRERREDIEILVNHFVDKFSSSLNKKIRGYDSSFVEPLFQYDFPGNVRELQNIVERAVTVAEGDVLTKEDLPATIYKHFKQDGEQILNGLREAKKNFVLKTLRETNFNISKAAKQLGISRPTLYRLLKDYRISL